MSGGPGLSAAQVGLVDNGRESGLVRACVRAQVCVCVFV